MTNAALYTRVSTDLQEKEGTIASQQEALREFAAAKGYTIVAEYTDDGYSGAKLQRPGLDRLRDALQTGDFYVVLFHSPGRLSRTALHQALVIEELDRAHVQPEFLNFAVDDSPESKMLFGMQGLFAEYERVKIAERTRRGKLYHAKQGALVGRYEPYGYTFVRRTDGQRAHLEVNEAKAEVVRLMYRWLVDEALSTRELARRLTGHGIPTSRGANQWQPMAVYRIVTSSVYRGEFRFNMAGSEEPIAIPVTAIVTPELWEAAQAQLRRNSELAQRNNKKHQYLLRGLVKCPRCGGAYHGYTQHGSRGYRCGRTDPVVSSTGQRCTPGAIIADPLERAVWEAVTQAFQQPDLLTAEYERRVGAATAPAALEAERKHLVLALKRTRLQEDRLTDAYINQAMELDRYKEEMEKLRQRRASLSQAEEDIEQRAHEEHDSQAAVGHIQRFCGTIAAGLDAMTFEEQQQFLGLVVERITVKDGVARIETIIPMEDQDRLRNAPAEPVEG